MSSEKHLLLKELQASSNFADADFPAFLELFTPLSVRKGEFVYKAGEVPKYSPFVMKGCLRKYFVNDAGDEQITLFAEEGWFAGEVGAMRTNTPTNMNLQALEDSEVLGITIENAEYGWKHFPEYLKYFTTRYPLMHARIIEESVRLKTESPENLYAWLMKERPSLILRVPQHYIANYLGVRTETISRIKNKLAQKH